MSEKMTDSEKMAALADLIAKGATFRELKGLTDSQMATIYTMGVNFYKAGRLEDAEKVFKFLVLFDHFNQKYWIGMGAVHQMKRNFEQARIAYEYAALLDIKQPKPIYHAAECYVALGRLEDAEATLAALERECPATNELNRRYLAKGKNLRGVIAKVKAASK